MTGPWSGEKGGDPSHSYSPVPGEVSGPTPTREPRKRPGYPPVQSILSVGESSHPRGSGVGLGVRRWRGG